MYLRRSPLTNLCNVVDIARPRVSELKVFTAGLAVLQGYSAMVSMLACAAVPHTQHATRASPQ